MDFECNNWIDKIASILLALGIIILYLAAGTIFSNLLLNILPFSNSNLGLNIIYSLAECLTTGILVIIHHKRLINDFKKFKKNYKKIIKLAFRCWLIGFILMAISNIIINLVITDNGMAANETANRQTLFTYPLYSILAMCLLAPISEELLFRASFKNTFKNILTYSLFTGIFFAAMHVYTGFDNLSLSSILANWTELLYFLPYSSLGIAMGYAFYKSDNIYTSIIMHIFHNSLSVGIILLYYFAGV